MAGGRFFALSDERLEMLRARRRAAGLEAVRDTDIPRRPTGQAPPPSFSQQRLWFLDRLAGGDAHLGIPAALMLEGDLDWGALGLALGDVVARHEPLRSRFREVEGELRVEVRAAEEGFRSQSVLPRTDLTGLPEERRQQEVGRLVGVVTGSPFDLAEGVVLVALLVDLGRVGEDGESAAERNALLLGIHHIAADGWSLGVLFRDLADAYGVRAAHGAEAPDRNPPEPLLAEPSVRYGDWAAWQRAQLRGERLAEEVSWWRQRLAGAPPQLDLPADRPPSPAAGFRSGTVRASLKPDLADRLRALGRHLPGAEASPFMVLLAVLAVLLARWSGSDDLVIGTPVAGRTRRETEGLVGLFLNHLALRLAVPPTAGFRAVLAGARDRALGAFAHQEVPFERLLEELSVPRDLATTPLFQVYLNLLSFPPPPPFGSSDLRVSSLAPPQPPARFDLTLYADDRGPGGALHLSLVHDARRFETARMEEALRQFTALAEQVVAAPERPVATLSLLTDIARRHLPDPRRRQDASWPGTVHAAVDRHAAATPGATAVVGADGTAISYTRLAATSRALAARLAASGVRRGDVVAVHAHREPALVAVVLAIHRVGAAFLLLDPAHPAPRNAQCCRRAAPRALVTLAGAPAVPGEVVEAMPKAARLALPALLETGAWQAGAVGAGAVGAGAGEAGAGEAGAGEAVEVGPDDLAYVAFTSGSTGEPKGVLGRHRSLTHFLPWQQDTFSLGPADRFSQLSGLAHDPLHRDLFTPLWLGAAVVFPDSERFAAPGYLAAWLARTGVTVIHGTPSLLRLLAAGGEAAPRLTSLRWAFVVGEVLRPGDLETLAALAPRALAVNLYGATETQRAVAWHPVTGRSSGGAATPKAAAGPSAIPSASPVVPLGRGMPDVQLLVLGWSGGLAAAGEVGEVHVRSPHLAGGYLERPGDTAAVFVPDPFASGDPSGVGLGDGEGDCGLGGRLYRTGDLGRYRPDGAVQPLGRRDRQVKVRGFRVEPAEVEAVLALHPAVGEAAVVATGEASDARLVAYWTESEGVRGDPDATFGADSLADGPAGTVSRVDDLSGRLRAHLAAHLPAAMVPADLVRLLALPRTPNGKLDRAALPPVADPGGDARPADGAPPATPTEELLAGIWRQVLGVGAVPRDADFFALGGHSLALTRVLARVRDAFGVDLPVRRAFEAPTLVGQAAAVDELTLQGHPARPPLRPRDRAADPPPASSAQRRLWFLDRLTPGSAAYTLAAAVELRGDLRVAPLAAALTAMTRRHESLRTSLPAPEGEPVQHIRPAAEVTVPLPVIDLAALPEPRRPGEAGRLAASPAAHRFDLETGPLLAARLVRLNGGPAATHRLLLAVHHAVADGWSLGVMARELGALYSAVVGGAVVGGAVVGGAAGFEWDEAGLEAASLARRAGLPDLSVQYADWSEWQRDLLTGPTLDAQLAWWRQRLRGLPTSLDLPTDHPRGRREDRRGARVEHTLPGEVVAGLDRLGRRYGVTRYMLLLAGLAVVLSRWSGQRDLAIGSPEAGRGPRQVEPLVGLFLNLLVLRLDLSGEPTFSELLSRVREAVLGAFAHREVPFERLLEEVAPARDPRRPPLVEVLLNVLDVPAEATDFAGLEARLAPAVEREARFPLTLYAWGGGGSGGDIGGEAVPWVLRLVYQRALFDTERMAELLAQMGEVLAAAVVEPEGPVALLGGLTARGRGVLADPGVELPVPVPLPEVGTVVEAFLGVVERWPGRVAVGGGGERVMEAGTEASSGGYGGGAGGSRREPAGASRTPKGGRPPAVESAPISQHSETTSGSRFPSFPPGAPGPTPSSTEADTDGWRDPAGFGKSWERGCWTYRELASGMNVIADGLQAAGHRPGEVVAVGGRVGFELVAAALGVWRAGGVLLLLDSGLPVARRAGMMRLAEARWLVTPAGDGSADALRREMGPGFSFADLTVAERGGEIRVAGGDSRGGQAAPRRYGPDVAYLVFTSGTTGEPKGVLGSHRGLAHFLAWQRETFGIGPGDRVAQLTALSFDVVLRDLFLPLTSGATLVVPEDADLRLDPSRVPGWLDARGVTVLHAVPNLARAWLAAGDAPDTGTVPGLAALRWVFFAGEPLPAALVAAWRRSFPASPASKEDRRPAPAHGVVNLYGPTETTLARCAFVVPEPPEPGVQPVGRALPDSQALVLARAAGDSAPQWRQCGPGEVGEIVLRTPLRSHGYLRQIPTSPFFPNPFRAPAVAATESVGSRDAAVALDPPADLLYATGDLGRFRFDGTLEILGRRDDQVKVRGVRLEPAEVEAALAAHSTVSAAAVVVEPGSVEGGRFEGKRLEGDRLLAWVVPAPGAEVDPRLLRTHLARRLPPALVPSRYLRLAALPTGATGKLDRSALPTAPPIEESRGAGHVAPRDELEAGLAAIFEEVLEVAPVGVEDDFFALGGHSLLAVPLLSRVETRFGRRLPLAALFAHPTVGELAVELRASGATLSGATSGGAAPGRDVGSAAASVLVTLQAGAARPPLFLVHPGGGGVLCYADLARELGDGQPVHALQSVGLDGGEAPLTSIDAMAERYLAEVRRLRPRGPYHLGGWSFGGRVAFEMARRLRQAGEEVALLALLDITPDPSPGPAALRDEDDAALLARALAETFPVAAQELRGLDDRQQVARLLAAARAAGEARGRPLSEIDPRRAEALLAVFKANLAAARAFRQRPYPGEVLLLRAAGSDRFAAPTDGTGDPTGGWAALAEEVRVVAVPGDHHTLVRPPHVIRLADVLRTALEASVRNSGEAEPAQACAPSPQRSSQ